MTGVQFLAGARHGIELSIGLTLSFIYIYNSSKNYFFKRKVCP
jgi:hypothetical protein